MRKLFRENKEVIRFVLTFSGSYIIMVLFYSAYLSFFQSGKYYPDYITHLVARQTEALLEAMGYAAQVSPHPTELSMKLVVEEVFVARIVEGCNAVSVILLFAAFVLAFFRKTKPTLLFILAGAVTIYATNIVRISILAIGLYEYPEYADMLHGTVFPGIIYGMVFLLWLLWVFRFSKTKK